MVLSHWATLTDKTGTPCFAPLFCCGLFWLPGYFGFRAILVSDDGGYFGFDQTTVGARWFLSRNIAASKVKKYERNILVIIDILVIPTH